MLEEIQEIQEDDIYYYVIPVGYPLFKATKNYDTTTGGLFLDPNGFYFFGVKEEDPEYIASYEEEYGIIFEFVTKQEYKLLALDKKETQEKIYADAPNNIKNILEKNYGYNTKNEFRNSESDPDRELSQYLCKKGYNGYAIKHMATDFRGTFHPEFMFCDIRGIGYVKKITTDKRVDQILESTKLKTISTQMKTSRKQNRSTHSSNYENKNRINRFPGDFDDENNSTPYDYNTPTKKRLFGDDNDDDDNENKNPGKKLFDDDDDEMLIGGIHKKRTHKKRKQRKTVSRKNKKGTNKKGKGKKSRKTNRKEPR